MSKKKRHFIMHCLVFDAMKEPLALSLILLLPLFLSSLWLSLFHSLTCSCLSFIPLLLFHLLPLSLPHHLPFPPTTRPPPPPSRCKLRGLKSLKALTPVALIAAAAPTLAVWMGMNISSGGEEERGVEGGSGVEVDGEKRGGRRKRGRMSRGAKQVRGKRRHK